MNPILKFCQSIQNYEGVPGDLSYRNNNPGNCRCSPAGYLPKYGNVRCVNKFSVFTTMAIGMEYLENLVHQRVILHPEWTFLDFFTNYAPVTDGNDPVRYSNTVAEDCGVPPTTLVSAYFSGAQVDAP
jgi:hypothetical protein